MTEVGEARTAQTRRRAERALALLVDEIGDEEVFLVVLGGLVPGVLTRDEGAAIPSILVPRTWTSC